MEGRESGFVLEKFGGRYGTAFYLFLAFFAALVVDADGGLQFVLALFLAAQVNQHLAAQVMDCLLYTSRCV